LNPAGGHSNVVGFGLGVKWTDHQPTGTQALLVFVTQKQPAALLTDQEILPRQTHDGTPIDVVTLGDVTAEGYRYDAVAGDDARAAAPPAAPQAEPQTLRRRHRPAPAGVSIGNVDVTAGTMGSVVYDFLPG